MTSKDISPNHEFTKVTIDCLLNSNKSKEEIIEHLLTLKSSYVNDNSMTSIEFSDKNGKTKLLLSLDPTNSRYSIKTKNTKSKLYSTLIKEVFKSKDKEWTDFIDGNSKYTSVRYTPDTVAVTTITPPTITSVSSVTPSPQMLNYTLSTDGTNITFYNNSTLSLTYNIVGTNLETFLGFYLGPEQFTSNSVNTTIPFFICFKNMDQKSNTSLPIATNKLIPANTPTYDWSSYNGSNLVLTGYYNDQNDDEQFVYFNDFPLSLTYVNNQSP